VANWILESTTAQLPPGQRRLTRFEWGSEHASGNGVMRTRIARVAMPAERIAGALRRLGAPLDPRTVGWEEEAYRQAVLHAAEIRNRYTFLDLARDARVDPLPAIG